MYRVYEVRTEENLRIIADDYDIDDFLIRQINGFDSSYEVTTGELIVLPDSSKQMFHVYLVKAGDTQTSIARHFGLTPNDLAKMNGLSIDEYIYPGQEMLIPREGYGIHVTTEKNSIGDVEQIIAMPLEKWIANNRNLTLVPDQLILYEKEK